VLKIAQLLSPEQTVEVSEEIKQHMKEFMIAIQDEPVDMKSLSMSGITLLDMLNVFKRVYALDWER
jgi:hypothetical protein